VSLLNMKIFVDTDDDVRLARRIQRDTVERARDVAGVIDQYTKFVKPMFEQFVLPSKKVRAGVRFLTLTGSSLAILSRESFGGDFPMPWAYWSRLLLVPCSATHTLPIHRGDESPTDARHNRDR